MGCLAGVYGLIGGCGGWLRGVAQSSGRCVLQSSLKTGLGRPQGLQLRQVCKRFLRLTQSHQALGQ